MNLLATIQDRFRAALAGLVNDPARLADYLGMIKPAQGDRGDYQMNCAMALAKDLGKKPLDVAKDIVALLKSDDMFEPPQVAGPGFINLTLKADWLARQVHVMEADARLGVPVAVNRRVVVIDYSSPNVAKPLHVGHLRSTIIGDALKRILMFLGHTVISDNHLGDWGTQFGMLIYGYKQFRDDAALQTDPIQELVRIYQHVRQITKGKEDDEGDVARTADEAAHYQQCLEETAKLQSGDVENLAIWKRFVNWTMETVQPIYKSLGVAFDHYHGESFYNAMLPGVVQSLLKSGIAVESNGAVVVFLNPPAADDPDPRADAVIRKRDGAFTYMTSDLATIQYRVEVFKPHAILYVVGTPQAQHFQTLFATARRWGVIGVDLEHISFGSVLGNDRKMLSTRNGGAAELGELLAMAVKHGAAKYEQNRQDRASLGQDVPDLSPEERIRVAEYVGIGAVKYADLCQNRTSDYVFDWEKMLSTEGNSATYMQYAYTRCCGIFRKGGIDPTSIRMSPVVTSLVEPQERSLAVQLARFEETVHAAAREFLPHLLTGYLWELARAFNKFNDTCPVLKAPTPELRTSRLVLCDLTARVIGQSLGLLGIQTLERM